MIIHAESLSKYYGQCPVIHRDKKDRNNVCTFDLNHEGKHSWEKKGKKK